MRTLRPRAQPNSWLCLFRCLSLLGLLAPVVYYAFDSELPVNAVLLLLMLTILGFFGTVLWMYWLRAWRAVFPMLLAFVLFPFALLSNAAILTKVDLDSVRDRVMAQLGSAPNFIVRRADYHLTGFDPSGSWEIELVQPLPAPVLGWGPGLTEPDIDFSLRDVSEAGYSYIDIADRVAGVPGIANMRDFRVYAADTHYTSLCRAPGHCDVELTFSPDAKVLLLHVSNF